MRWGGTVVTVLLLAVWVGSYRWRMRWAGSNGLAIAVVASRVTVLDNRSSANGPSLPSLMLRAVGPH